MIRCHREYGNGSFFDMTIRFFAHGAEFIFCLYQLYLYFKAFRYYISMKRIKNAEE